MAFSADQERIEAVGEQLRAKIASKFTASTFLAGFSLAMLPTQIFSLWQSETLPMLLPLSIGIVFASVVLFVDAVIRLDELTMPKRFWPESPAARHSGHPRHFGLLVPDDLENLQQHMAFLWYRLTIVAVVLAFAAIVIVLVPLPIGAHDAKGWSLAAAVAGLGGGLAYCAWLRRMMRKRFPAFVGPVD